MATNTTPAPVTTSGKKKGPIVWAIWLIGITGLLIALFGLWPSSDPNEGSPTQPQRVVGGQPQQIAPSNIREIIAPVGVWSPEVMIDPGKCVTWRGETTTDTFTTETFDGDRWSLHTPGLSIAKAAGFRSTGDTPATVRLIEKKHDEC